MGGGVYTTFCQMAYLGFACRTISIRSRRRDPTTTSPLQVGREQQQQQSLWRRGNAIHMPTTILQPLLLLIEPKQSQVSTASVVALPREAIDKRVDHSFRTRRKNQIHNRQKPGAREITRSTTILVLLSSSHLLRLGHKLQLRLPSNRFRQLVLGERLLFLT